MRIRGPIVFIARLRRLQHPACRRQVRGFPTLTTPVRVIVCCSYVQDTGARCSSVNPRLGFAGGGGVRFAPNSLISGFVIFCGSVALVIRFLFLLVWAPSLLVCLFVCLVPWSAPTAINNIPGTSRDRHGPAISRRVYSKPSSELRRLYLRETITWHALWDHVWSGKNERAVYVCTVSCHVHIRSYEEQTLDANRSFARELARTFSARMGKGLWLVFPDDAEVKQQAPPTYLRHRWY